MRVNIAGRLSCSIHLSLFSLLFAKNIDSSICLSEIECEFCVVFRRQNKNQTYLCVYNKAGCFSVTIQNTNIHLMQERT